jgi:hypothetical protein
MKVKVLNEAGYDEAIRGIGLSYGIDDFEHLSNVARKLQNKDGGHNKFLESLQMWLEIRAPRGWWAEFDTYRLMTKQSESTMHTIQKRLLTKNDFEIGTEQDIIDVFNKILKEETNNFSIKNKLSGKSLQRVKWNLPEGFLQTRIVCLNYKSLRNIFFQRRNHKLKQWEYLIKYILSHCRHPELLPDVYNKS